MPAVVVLLGHETTAAVIFWNVGVEGRSQQRPYVLHKQEDEGNDVDQAA